MNNTNATYGKLDAVLRLLGFTCRMITDEPPARVYEHHQTNASIILPAFPDTDELLDYHLLAVRTMLDLHGIADPLEFAAKLKKAG